MASFGTVFRSHREVFLFVGLLDGAPLGFIFILTGATPVLTIPSFPAVAGERGYGLTSFPLTAVIDSDINLVAFLEIAIFNTGP